MQHNNHNYSFTREYKGKRYYHCSKYRTTNCRGKLTVSDDNKIEESKDLHTCIPKPDEEVILRDITSEMNEIMEKKSITDLSIVPRKVWSNCRDEMIKRIIRLLKIERRY